MSFRITRLNLILISIFSLLVACNEEDEILVEETAQPTEKPNENVNPPEPEDTPVESIEYTFSLTIGGSKKDLARSVIQTSDGGYMVAGESSQNDLDVAGNNLVQGSWLVKFDTAGEQVWQKSFGGSDFDIPTQIIETRDGNFVVSGYTSSVDGDISDKNDFSLDYWIMKVDVSGGLIWSRTFGNSKLDIATSVEQTMDGGYILTGYSDVGTTFSGLHDYWILKLDEKGELLWSKFYGGSNSDLARSVKQTPDGGYIVLGTTTSDDGDVTGTRQVGTNDLWVVRLNENGDLVWEKTIGGLAREDAYSMVLDDMGGVVILASSSSNDGDIIGNSEGDTVIWIFQLRENGDIGWQNVLPGSIGRANSFDKTIDGGYIISGSKVIEVAEPDINYDVWLAKLDSRGNLLWDNSFGGPYRDTSNSIRQTSDGGYVIAGVYESENGYFESGPGPSNFYDYWILKLNEDGEL